MLFDEDIQDDPIDMEPLKILRDISLKDEYGAIDGSLQIGKIYKSNLSEFFGIYWPSSKGRPCFQGREYNELNKPLVRYFNPDSFEILESDLPDKLTQITEGIYGTDFEFVRDCYEEETGHLKSGLPEKTKHTLRLIFKDLAYRLFIKQQKQEEETH